jgi:superfamily II RNA helicase
VEEKKLVDEVFHNAMDVLSEEDRQLPQVENVLPLLRRGIGIHHGGQWNKALLLFMLLCHVRLMYHY